MDQKQKLGWNGKPSLDQLLPGPGILLSRALIYLVLALLGSGAAWAYVTSVDVVVSARGRLVVDGEPIRITTSESALVVDLPVRVGQHVSAGDVLMRLDAFRHRKQAERVQALINTVAAERERHERALRAIAKRRAAIVTQRESVEEIHDLIDSDVRRAEELLREGVISAAEVGKQRLERIEVRSRLARLDSELLQLDGDSAERSGMAEESRARAAELGVQLEQEVEYETRSTIVAPVAGTVTHLAVLHPGSMLDAREPAVILVPDGQPLRAKIDIANADMRRLERGLDVLMEFDAFPRQDHGVVQGTLLEIEPDANQDGNYSAWISIANDPTGMNRLAGQLRPGYLLEARIVVDRRRLSAFLLDPIRRLDGPISIGE